MPTPFESATLNLRLFELRRDPALRAARDWFLRDFNPASFAEFAAIAGGARNVDFRMVLGYWDMAASLVVHGAVDAESWAAAHGEVFMTFAKVQPFLAELRAATGAHEFCRHLEQVVTALPGADAILENRRAQLRAFLVSRAAAAAPPPAADA